MASTKTRQRKLERDRYERKMVRRAQQQRRRRRIQAGLGAFLALAVLGVGTAWLMGGLDSLFAPGEEDPQAVDRCFWQEQEGPQRIDVGTPPGDPPTSGVQTVTVDLDAGAAGSGQVEFQMNLDSEPCGAATVAHLAAEGFYDETVCHELTGEGALRCGDPTETSEGGPAFVFYGENYPFDEFDPDATDPDGTDPEGEEPEVLYPAGTVAFADVAGAHGSQLLIFFEDYAPEGPLWPILGTVTSGLDLLEAVGAAGAVAEPPGPPAEEVRIRTLTVAEPETGTGAPDLS